MDFLTFISTPKDTLVSAPLITKIKLTRGRLTGGWIYFPYGPAGTLHLVITRGIHQLFPFNTGQNLSLDDAVIPLSLGIDLDQPPYQVEAITWNDSTTLQHVLSLCLFLDPQRNRRYNLDQLKKLFDDLSPEVKT